MTEIILRKKKCGVGKKCPVPILLSNKYVVKENERKNEGWIRIYAR